MNVRSLHDHMSYYILMCQSNNLSSTKQEQDSIKTFEIPLFLMLQTADNLLHYKQVNIRITSQRRKQK